MTDLHWQKSTYSETASSCVYLAAPSAGTILLREGDEPETMLITGPLQLAALISTLHTPHRSPRA
ncbi:DUF397 domain-containing protein [Streptomyces liliifuscus]|uniref:DUF397 domain-containing protein n=1 Tax=Streptomyces liliifuscus TaxID=2797636 RepID=A0A7T7KYK3_9ACTN|nr:DUF397 domain-containing protein [Streptomyces liliifuscus]QQM43172.1 DUF397 domain-containing protein [Streptomyces liliifuscus]